MTFPIEHAPLRSLSEIEAERLENAASNDAEKYDDNPAASFKDDDK